MSGEEQPPTKVKFKYGKSNYFRVIHVDGAHGGISPNLHVHMAIYSERRAIPRRVVHDIKPDGSLGEIVEKETEEGVFREVEADLVLSLNTAMAVRAWLDDRIKEIEKYQRISAESEGRE